MTIGYFGAMAVVVVASAAAAAEQPRAQALPGWLAGGWLAQTGGGKWTEEWWTPPRGGLMLGGGRSGKGDKVDWWELTRIEQSDGTIRFCALPKGQKGACFTATNVTADEITFENPGHDFPTRVQYRRSGSGIDAEISGPAGANAQRWRFEPIR